MTTYRKRLRTVEAMQLTTMVDSQALIEWAGGAVKPGPGDLPYLVLHERGGPTRINPGDWVVKNGPWYEKWFDTAFRANWEPEATYDAEDWMGNYCVVCLRNPPNVLHTHTAEERRVARERVHDQLARKLGKEVA